jgi:hypothetical protein
MLAAAVFWLMGVRTAAPETFAQNVITLAFVLLVVLMLVATLWAAGGVVRGLAPRRGKI